MKLRSDGIEMAIQLKTSIPGPKSQALFAERQAQVARGPFHVTPIFIKSATGAILEDVDGNHLIDFAAGIGVANVGHAPENVSDAVRDQAGKFLHVGFNVTPYESYVRVCEKLNKHSPGNFPKKSFLVNSGAEAVENAIKIARAYTGRQAVVCFDHAYHGRTYMAMSLTSKAKPYKYGFGPFNSEIYRAPFPYAYRWNQAGNQPGNQAVNQGNGSAASSSVSAEQVSRECFKQFEDLVNSQIGATQVAAVILEPVLGEGGFVPAPKEFLAKLREFCTTHKIVLIADEIQTGFGRTGTLFASEQLGLVPDLIVTAKGLGGGMPLSAVTGRAEIMDAPMEGGIGGTYCGNPVACAASLAVFETFEKTDLLARAKTLGEAIQSKLREWQKNFAVVGDVRGLGPMQAIELVKDRTTKEPDSESAKKLVRYCYERGLIIMTAGTQGNVVRLLMPLVIDSAALQEGLAILESGLQEVSGKTAGSR
jgi:4-aminobutyrate aminotransferase/(S)-3-amino-2-methylpropionate transaminase